MKRSLIASLLAASAGVAHAAPVTYFFEYKGLDYWQSGDGNSEWLPGATISGSFAGEDFNNDGVIAQNEISYVSLKSDITEFYFPNGIAPTSPDSSTRLYFVFFGNRPTINASRTSYSPEGTVTGQYEINVSNTGAASTSYVDSVWRVYSSLDQTTFTSSVPEPSSAVMGLAGLAILGAVAHRRRNC